MQLLIAYIFIKLGKTRTQVKFNYSKCTHIFHVFVNNPATSHSTEKKSLIYSCLSGAVCLTLCTHYLLKYQAMLTINIPDVVFLALGISVLLTVLSIRAELKKISRRRRRRKHHHGISFEEQNKLRARYFQDISLRQPA